MSKIKFLGELDELVLLTTAVLHDDEAYGYAVVKEISDKTGKKVSLSAVHTVLYRLQDRGLVRSELGGASGHRGGRSKRLFYVTQLGKNSIIAIREQRNRYWHELGGLSFGLDTVAI
jgi:DNA-binding PadR family transcriptional regulator